MIKEKVMKAVFEVAAGEELQIDAAFKVDRKKLAIEAMKELIKEIEGEDSVRI